MTSALLISILFLILSKLGMSFSHDQIMLFMAKVKFSQLVMHFMLGLLLFAGALTIDLSHLREEKVEIAILTIISTVVSAFLVAFLVYGLLHLLGIPLKFVYCMLFGSLISPTDPIAVLALFKKLGIPKRLETIVSAESLFNDGVGVVLFLTTFKLAFAGVPATIPNVMGLFLQEAAGGVVYGLVVGFVIYWLLRPINDSKVEILLTLALVFGSYTFAQAIGISGPLAMVVAGIFVANYKRSEAMSVSNRAQLNNFWELVEEVLNTILFLLLGFELLIIHFDLASVTAAILVIPLVLLVRYITVALPITIIKPWRQHTPYTISILTWGGLRGGLAVALALLIPPGHIRDVILTYTYAVVLFAILVQGNTMTRYVKLANRFSVKREERKQRKQGS
jgi:CPA1 family monovalent cation:H+ antiporter